MEDLAFMDQEAILPPRPIRSWALSQYDARIYIRTTRVRWAEYGLLTAVSVIGDARIYFRPCLIYFFWQDQEEGVLKFSRRDEPFTADVATHPTPLPNAIGNAVNDTAADPLNTLLYTSDPDPTTPASNTSHDSSNLLSRARLQVIPSYNGSPMPSRNVFIASLSVMVLGAERGPDEPCPRISGNSWEITPIWDAEGKSLLKFRSLIRAMRLLTRWMAANRRFAEVDIELKRDGVVIGHGQLRRFGSLNAGQ